MPTFSVIVPTYGRGHYLREALRSILAQTVPDLEVVVVDDGSPAPVEVVYDPRVRLLRLPRNQGAARARNVGVEAATGEILAFLDDDDTWTPDRLSFAQEALARAPVAVCWQSPRGRVLEGDVHGTILDATTPSLGATALLRTCWLPMDQTYATCEDLVWWLGTSRQHRVATHPRQGLCVRRHDGPRTGYGTDQRIRDSLRILREHDDYFAAHRRARAFRWKRIGLMNLLLGRSSEARRAFLHALTARPTAADLLHLLRTWVPERSRS